MDRPHECPAPGCSRKVPFDQLACRDHWYALPKDLRDEVWAAFRRNGQGSPRHQNAVGEAIRWLRENVRDATAEAARESKRLDAISDEMTDRPPRRHYRSKGHR